MKLKITILIAIIAGFTTISQASKLAPADSFILEGTILTSSKSALSGVILNVYLNKKKVGNSMSNFFGGFKLKFKHNEVYEVEMLKKGFITQRFAIDTKVSKEIIEGGGIGNTFDFVIEMLDYFPGVNTSMFSKPVLFYYFDGSKGWFFYEDEKKSKRKELDEIKAQVNEIRKKTFDLLVKKGDSLKVELAYIDALESFTQALAIYPKDADAKRKSDDLKKILKNANSFEKLYKDLIALGDKNFQKKDYTIARNKYEQARSYNDKDIIAAAKIFTIDSLIAVQYQENLDRELAESRQIRDKQKADSLKALRAKQEKDSLEQALAMQREEEEKRKMANAQQSELDKKKQAELDKQKEKELKELEKKYRSIITLADKNYKNKKYTQAIDQYNKALEIKPGDNYATLQINRSNELIAKQDADRLTALNKKRERDSIAKLNAQKKKEEALAKSQKKESETIVKEENQKKNDKPTPIEEPVVIDDSDKDTSKEAIVKTKKIAQNLEKQGKDVDAAKVYMNLGNKQSKIEMYGESLTSFKKALEIYKKRGDKVNIAVANNQVANVYLDSGLYKESVKSKYEVIGIKKEINDPKGVLETLKEIGTIHENTFKPDDAEKVYIEALILTREIKDPIQETAIIEKLGDLYSTQNDFEKAIESYQQALKISTLKDLKENKTTLLNNLGVIYAKKGDYDKAIELYTQTIETAKQQGNLQNAAYAYNNIGNVNFERKQYNAAILYYEKALKLKKQTDQEEGIASSLFNIGFAYYQMKNYEKAVYYLEQSLEISLKTNFREGISQNYKIFAFMYDQMEQYQKAVSAYKGYFKYYVPGIHSDGPITETQSMYSYETGTVSSLRKQLQKQRILTDYEAMMNLQKQKQIEFQSLEIEQKNTIVNRQRILLGFTALCLILAVAMGYNIYKRYKEKKEFSEIIAFQHKQITDSINYARRIQQAVLPSEETVKTCISNGFLLNKPKDIVSGDYYFTTTKGHLLYLAVADCTGHGVPGGFMSMLGISFLKEIIANDQSANAHEILEKLRATIISALNQTGKDSEMKDGMDFSLAIIDTKKRTLKFAGANNKGLLFNNGNLKELLADRMPIGIHPNMRPFKSEEIEYQPNDILYLYTDGFVDQIGEKSNKKFKIRQFIELLMEIHNLPVEQQQTILDQKLESWKGAVEQTDDITVMGFRLS